MLTIYEMFLKIISINREEMHKSCKMIQLRASKQF